jgi:nitric oxide reductase NorD protein
MRRFERFRSHRWTARLHPSTRQPDAAPGHPPLAFQAVERVLALFVAGFTAGALTVRESARAAEGAYTDGQTIFVPPQYAAYPTPAGNLLVYKCTVAHAAAQVRYGTLATTADYAALREAVDPALAADLFTLVEGARLTALLATEFPGLGRDLARLGRAAVLEQPPLTTLRGRALVFAALEQHLLAPSSASAAPLGDRPAATVRDVLAPLPAPVAWAGLTRQASVALTLALAARIAPLGAGPTLAPLPGRSRIRLDQFQHDLPVAALPERLEPPRSFKVSLAPPARPALVVEGKEPPRMLPNEEDRRPENRPGGRQVAVAYADTLPQFTARLLPLTLEEKRGAFVYPEWDITIGAYRSEWVALRPRRLRAANADWVERVLRQRHAQVQALKRQFEALRPERQRLRRQDDGEDLDLDVAVESYVDRRLGLPPGERPYARTREQRRDIAVAFLIDLSGSTGGYVAGPHGGERVIDVARGALVLLCEALTMLNDRHAIYGFSGSTRKGCEFYTVKDFADAYDDETKRRISGLAPLSYTRLGPPIRHTTTLLHAVSARVKLLMLLSDGRPNDFDAYGGEYGITDTRKALLEARSRGIRTFCLTIDAEARDYMPRLFGPDNYAILANVAALPRRLPDLYRRLTV